MPAKPGALLENQPLSCLFKISPGLKSLRCAVCRVLCCLVSTPAGGPAVEPSPRLWQRRWGARAAQASRLGPRADCGPPCWA